MTANKNKDIGTVYSTEYGRMCPACGKPIVQCVCRQQKIIPQSDGIVRIGRETKGGKGKGVTVISGISLDYDGLIQLAKQLKQKCGTGGTIKNGIIEIQGDHRDVVVAELKKRGFNAKRLGS